MSELKLTEVPDIIDIADLHNPVLTDLQKQVMQQAAENPVPLDVESILNIASQNTGLSDFGDLGFKKNMQVWIDSANADTELNALGRASVFGLMLTNAEKRLRIEDMINRFPEILDIEIREPIIIAGLPRSGTTYLQNFLGGDPRLRSLPYWEAMRPVPTDEEFAQRGEADPRREKCAQEWVQQDAVLPYIKAIHEFSPDHISEDIELQLPEFGSYYPDWLFNARAWDDYYFQLDHVPVYEYLKKCLKVLNFLTGEKRWLLKCPQHMEQLPVLKKVFPDATIVINHRDPVASIQSAATATCYGNRIRYPEVNVQQTMEYDIWRYAKLLTACVRDRDSLDDSKTVDVYFHELMENPMAIVAEIYRKADLRFDDTIKEVMEKSLARHPRGKNGRMIYDLERDFGMTAESIRAHFDFYFDRFSVKAEVK